MKLKTFSLILLAISLWACQQEKPNSLIEHVNPFIGTGGHGHTYPGATMPFGMMQLSPDTRLDGWDGCSGYHYSDSLIYGFSHTHLSGTGVSDYGDLLLMPSQGEIYYDNGFQSKSEKSYRSSFQKKNEKAKPGSYQVLLDKHNIAVELITAKRAGVHKYTFAKEGEGHIILDLLHRDKLLADTLITKENRIVEGKRISKAWATEQHFYFSLEFSKAFKTQELDSSGKKAAFVFDLEANETISVKVGISAVSIAGARKNLAAEIPAFDSDKLRKDTESAWEKALAKIEVETENKDQLSIFYTALYHSMLAPNTFSDVDGKYRGMDMQIHESDHPVYTIFSLWDTFRAAHPLYTIIEQDKTNDFIKTFLKQYEQGGILPIWELSANYTGCMIGYHAIPVIADAYLKGIRAYDPEKALKAMVHSANQDKLGLEAYKSRGFIEIQDESESVSKVLEYAYDDWCIAAMAEEMGEKQTAQEFIERAQYFKNQFNPENGFMQSKSNASFTYGFDPSEVNFNFTEANSWQYSMFAPQDISGLIELYGGESAFEEKLDQLFTTEMELSGREQVDITGLIGQYAHGNEPSHHMAYLYNYIGKAYKTQERVHQILKEQYHNQPDGLSGNEDCGQMSAWYVLSSMGFYSVSPGLDYYSIGTPLFKQVSIHLENGNHFHIEANNLTDDNKYIQSAKLNGNALDGPILKHEAIMQGGALVFEMGAKPNKTWGSEVIPESKIAVKDQIVAVPFFKGTSRTFVDSMEISLAHVDSSAELYLKINEEEFKRYEGAVWIKKTSAFEAYAQKGKKRSKLVQGVDFKKIKGGRSIVLESKFSNEYSAGGNMGLIDMLKGSDNFRTGFWQGYRSDDLIATVDLGEIETIRRISLGALQDIKSWIFFPSEVNIYISKDGKDFKQLTVIKNEFPDREYGAFTQEFELKLASPVQAKYVKIIAKNYGEIGDWHLGDGNDAWLFVDEISVE